ncbi:hypothetical protein ACI2K4_33395 [Micromonospora sp. NPDC050397]|uniref:hypothetical protein n=1 Tax=Micromonospora sp. NPDC050397 TaxID=3364279 RepID=UPI00384ED357
MAQRYGHDEGLTLARLDSLGDSEQLREEARRQLTQAGGSVHLSTHYEGTDRSNSIWVSVDPGGQVVGVELSRLWRERLEPAGFASALFESYGDAVRKLTNTTALAALAAREESGGRPFDPAVPADAGSGTMPVTAAAGRSGGRPQRQPVPEEPVDEREWLASTWDLLEDINRRLRRLDRINSESTARESSEETLTSPHGHFTVRLRGRTIAGVTGDLHRVRGASDDQLRREALAVFRAAQANGQ